MKKIIIAYALCLPFCLFAKVEKLDINSTKSFLVIDKRQSSAKLFKTKDGSLVKNLKLNPPADIYEAKDFIFPLAKDDKVVIVSGKSIDIYSSITGNLLLEKACLTCFDPGYLATIKPLIDGNFLVATKYNPETQESAKVIKVNSKNGRKIYEFNTQVRSGVRIENTLDLNELNNGKVTIKYGNHSITSGTIYRYGEAFVLLNGATGQVLYEIDTFEPEAKNGQLWCEEMGTLRKKLLCRKKFDVVNHRGLQKVVMEIVDSNSGQIIYTEVKNPENDYIVLSNSNFIEIQTHELRLFKGDGSLIKTHQISSFLEKNEFYSLKNGDFLHYDATFGKYALYNGQTGEVLHKDSLGPLEGWYRPKFTIHELDNGDMLAVLNGRYGKTSPHVISGKTGEAKSLGIDLNQHHRADNVLFIGNGNFAIEFVGDKTLLFDGSTLEVLAEVNHNINKKSNSKTVGKNLVVLVTRLSEYTGSSDYQEVKVINGTSGVTNTLIVPRMFHEEPVLYWTRVIGDERFLLQTAVPPNGRENWLILYDVNAASPVSDFRISRHSGFNYYFDVFPISRYSIIDD